MIPSNSIDSRESQLDLLVDLDSGSQPIDMGDRSRGAGGLFMKILRRNCGSFWTADYLSGNFLNGAF